MVVKVEHLGEIPIEDVKIKGRFREDKGDISAMAESLRERGLIHAIVVNGKFELKAGERRLLAAKQLGWKKIRAEMRIGDTPEDELAVERDENVHRAPFRWPELAKLEKTIWDMQAAKDPKWSLRKQEELRDVSRNVVMMRVKLAEALPLLPELGECETQDEAWKKYKRLEEEAGVEYLRQKVPDKIKQAPQWASEHYQVGDAFEGMAARESDSADFAEVDPPYGIDLVRRKDRNKETELTDEYNEIDEDEFPRFFMETAHSVFRILRPNSFAVFWFGTQWYTEVYETLKVVGFQVNSTPALWYKGQSGQTAQPDIMLASCYEPFLLARKGTPRMRRQGRANVFHYPPIPHSKKIHATEKPMELLEDILDTILFPGSEILVPFLGSGVTLRTAYKLGHTGFGWDLSEKHKARFLRLVAGLSDDEDLEEVDEEGA